MGYWPAKVDEQPITEILSHVPFILLDDLSSGGLISADHLTQVFRIKLLGEFGGVGQVTEHHSQLPAFGFGGAASWFRGDGWLVLLSVCVCGLWRGCRSVRWHTGLGDRWRKSGCSR